MKIAIILNSLAASGTNIATKDFIDELIKNHKFEVTVFSLKKFQKGDLIFENVKIFNFFSTIPFYKYDIIYSCTFRSDLYVYLNKKITKKNGKTKFVNTIHNIIEEDLYYDYGFFISKIFSRFWLYIKKCNDKIVVSSESMLKYYENSIHKNKLNLIEYGRSKNSFPNFQIPINDVKLISKLQENYTIVGTIGSFIKRKNYTLVVDLLLKYDELAWVSLGTGEEEENIKDLITRNGLESRVLFLGNRPDSRPYYNFFDLFFHPSRSEGFALVLIDAMSNKKSILLARLPVYKSILKDDMVFYFELDNNKSLFNAFNKLKQNHNSTNVVVEKAYNIYINRFSISKYGNKYANLFKN